LPAALPARVGQERFELSTPRLSSVCSNQLSYWPFSSRESVAHLQKQRCVGPSKLSSKIEFVRRPSYCSANNNRDIDRDGRNPKASTYLQKGGDPAAPSDTATLLRLHPSYQSLLKDLPPLRVSAAISGATDSHGVTGGVYKARERIHPCLLIRDY
jgi:hypothetical protein